MDNQNLIPWLLSGPPWVQYRTRLDLMGESVSSTAVIQSRQNMLDHPAIQGLVAELSDWPGHPLKRHNDASHPIHKLAFLADIGLDSTDPGIEPIVDRVLERRSPEGPFQIIMNIHPRYGGKGEDQWVWMLCDAPLIVYSLIKFGYGSLPEVKRAVDHLAGLVQENGWPCKVTPDLGRFKGPGRRNDPCPYASLVMLKTLALLPALRDSEICRIGTETLLNLWERRKEVRPYLFAMGTHFSRIKAPLIWYDILHVAEVLSQFPMIHKDSRWKDMIIPLESKSDGNGRYTPESIWMAWKGWDFGQKKEPSYWISLLVHRIFSRIEK